MMRAALLSVIGVLMLGAAAHAQPTIYHGNDTGGIIPWSCENEAMAQQAAAAYCARWDKYHRITSVHRQYGDLFDRVMGLQQGFHFSSSDVQAGLPADYTFQASDHGAATFPAGVTLLTLGNRTLTATDPASGMTGSVTVTVGPGP